MSGGSYDYAFGKINAFANEVERRAREPEAQGRNLRLAFARHLRKVADAAYQLEWADSGDTSWPDPVPHLRAIVKPADELQAAMANANAALLDLQAAIAGARKEGDDGS